MLAIKKIYMDYETAPVGVSHMPQFKTYQVNVEGLTIEMLAERLNVEVDLMKEYNHLPAGTNLKLGEWLVIPMHQD